MLILYRDKISVQEFKKKIKITSLRFDRCHSVLENQFLVGVSIQLMLNIYSVVLWLFREMLEGNTEEILLIVIDIKSIFSHPIRSVALIFAFMFSRNFPWITLATNTHRYPMFGETF